MNAEDAQIIKIRELIVELLHDKELRKNALAIYLGLEKKQYWSFYKFIQGHPFPRYLHPVKEHIIKSILKLLDDPFLLQKVKEESIQKKKAGNEKLPISPWVLIPFDMKFPVVEYNGPRPVPSIIQSGPQKGMVTFRNTSGYVADGEIYIDHIGMTTEIESGTKLAIKRIDKQDWKTDRYYVIIDGSDQIGIWELLADDDDKKVRLVSTSFSESHKIILLERIAAIFSIVGGSCIPRPKRNAITASISPQ
jgi:hypothetical protein